MKTEDIFRQWKASRSNVTVPRHFASKVMQTIRTDESRPRFSTLDQWMPSMIGRWSAALTLTGLGLFRLIFMIGHLIGAGSVAP